MPSIGVEFLIQEHGAAKVRAELDRLAGSTAKVSAATPRFTEQLSRLGSTITGPLGVATGVALATKRLIDLGAASASTEKQIAAFSRFDAAVANAQGRVGDMAAEVLSMPGVMDTLTGSLDLVVGAGERLVIVIRLAEPLLQAVGYACDAAAIPARLLAEAGNFVVDSLKAMLPLWEEEADVTEASRAEAEKLTWAFGDLERQERELTGAINAHRRAREAQAAEDRARRAGAIQENEKAESERALVERALERSKQGTGSIRRNIDELRAAERLALKAMNEAEQAVADSAEGTAYYSSKVRDAAQAVSEWQQLAGAIEGYEARNQTAVERSAKTVERYALTVRDLEFALADARDAAGELFEPLSKWPDILETAQAFNAIRVSTEPLGKLFDRIGEKWDDLNERMWENRRVNEKLQAAEKTRNDALWAGAEGGSALIKTIAQNAWVDAVLGAALETAKGIGTALTNPAESVTHFASAAQYLVAQAIASANGGGGSGSSSGAASAAAPSSAPPSVTTQDARDDVRGDSAYTIEVDGEVFGRVAARSVNKAARRGAAVLDRRTTSTRNGRRGLT